MRDRIWDGFALLGMISFAVSCTVVLTAVASCLRDYRRRLALRRIALRRLKASER